jgi:Ca2+-binding EF-hand superfamily protein
MGAKSISCALAASVIGLALNSSAADLKADYDRRAAERYGALFRDLDLDRDGMISKVEARGDLNFRPAFDDMDINRDGIVTTAELQRFLEQRYGVRIEFGR